MPMCSVIGCFNCKKKNSLKTAGLSFHHLPLKQPLILQAWLRQLGKSTPTTAVVCSDHFEDTMFLQCPTNQKRRLLKRNAIPTIFGHPKHQNIGKL